MPSTLSKNGHLPFFAVWDVYIMMFQDVSGLREPFLMVLPQKFRTPKNPIRLILGLVDLDITPFASKNWSSAQNPSLMMVIPSWTYHPYHPLPRHFPFPKVEIRSFPWRVWSFLGWDFRNQVPTWPTELAIRSFLVRNYTPLAREDFSNFAKPFVFLILFFVCFPWFFGSTAYYVTWFLMAIFGGLKLGSFLLSCGSWVPAGGGWCLAVGTRLEEHGMKHQFLVRNASKRFGCISLMVRCWNVPKE